MCSHHPSFLLVWDLHKAHVPSVYVNIALELSNSINESGDVPAINNEEKLANDGIFFPKRIKWSKPSPLVKRFIHTEFMSKDIYVNKTKTAQIIHSLSVLSYNEPNTCNSNKS